MLVGMNLFFTTDLSATEWFWRYVCMLADAAWQIPVGAVGSLSTSTLTFFVMVAL
jgi:hypothetical protein